MLLGAWRWRFSCGCMGLCWRVWSGGVAQLGEHLLCKQGVVGSNPIASTVTGVLAGCVAV